MFASHRRPARRALSTRPGIPVVSSASLCCGPLPSPHACAPRSLPTALIRRPPQLEHRFRIALCPVNAVPLEPEVDHAADRTLDRTTAQRYSPASETVVSQSARLRVPGQVADLAPYRLVPGLARR